MPLAVIVGPTAVGKSDVLYRLIDALGAGYGGCRCGGGRRRGGAAVEVINGDAIQCYRGIDIGSAKPSVAVRACYPHHLIDVLEPRERYSVAEFVRRVRTLAAAIVRRGRLPVLCGGSVYFILHVLRGLPDTPPPSAEMRARLERRADEEGIEALYRELAAVDPLAAARIGRADRFRIVRKLEIYHATGRPPSEFARFAVSGVAGAGAAHPNAAGINAGDFRALCIKLVAPRGELRARSAVRLEGMFAAGLIDEVRALVRRGYGRATPALSAIGYRQFFLSDGRLRPLDTPSERDAVKRDILTATARYAKHQLTFMRQLPAARAYCRDEFTAILARTRAFLSTRAVQTAPGLRSSPPVRYNRKVF